MGSWFSVHGGHISVELYETRDWSYEICFWNHIRFDGAFSLSLMLGFHPREEESSDGSKLPLYVARRGLFHASPDQIRSS